MSRRDPYDTAAIEVARTVLVTDLLTKKPGDEEYDFNTTLGEIELYRIRRALFAAIVAYNVEARQT